MRYEKDYEEQKVTEKNFIICMFHENVDPKVAIYTCQ